MHISNLAVTGLLAISSPTIVEKVPNIVKIETLSDISVSQPQQTLFLFDIDDTLIDSNHMLGTKAWRRYIREATKKIDDTQNWHDVFSYFLAKEYPYSTVETQTGEYVKKLQENGYAVCGLTTRERSIWYNMHVEGVDKLTVNQLHSINIDLNNKSLENSYPELSMDFEYYEGVFFANEESKGAYLTKLLKTAHQLPKKIIFIDDKRDQVESVAKALAELGIEHECFFYPLTDAKAKSFNPLIANIQLYYFYESKGQKVISDQAGLQIAKENPEKDAEHYLRMVIDLAK